MMLFFSLTFSQYVDFNNFDVPLSGGDQVFRHHTIYAQVLDAWLLGKCGLSGHGLPHTTSNWLLTWPLLVLVGPWLET